MLKRFFLCLMLISYLAASSQEFNCRVSVLHPRVQTSDKEIFKHLEVDIQDFINSRRWTEHLFSDNEKIECIMIFTIDTWENETFTGNLQIQASRPVFNSDYSTNLLLYKDEDISFTYSEFTTLEWDENSTPDNLIAIISYYAYLVLGLDYASFELNGGKPYFDKASSIVQQMQSTQNEGWLSFQSRGNRYWLIENIQNPSFYSFHECMYMYHRLGLDNMNDDLTLGKNYIKNSLLQLEKIYSIEHSSHLLQVFFESKSDEILKIVVDFPEDDKKLMKSFLMEVNPANTFKYKKIKVS